MKINKIANFINNSKTAQAILKNVNDNPAIWGAASSFLFASMLRPAALEVTPFKKESDRRYSQASAIASGLTELAFSTALFIPLNKSIKTSSDNLYKAVGTVYHKNPEILRNYKSLTNRFLKVGFLLPISLIRFSLVKPIVNTLFGGKKNENK